MRLIVGLGQACVDEATESIELVGSRLLVKPLEEARMQDFGVPRVSCRSREPRKLVP
ncbi:hypothetical protein GCM10027053_15540 [Intrasporangium mesophilum]